MFEDSLVEAKIAAGKKASTVVVSTLAHVALVGVLLVVPLLVTEALPACGGFGDGAMMLGPGLGAPPPPPPPPPLGNTTTSSTNTNRTNVVELIPVDTPTETYVPIPDPVIVLPTRTAAVPQVLASVDLGELGGEIDGVRGGVPGGVRGGVLDGVIGGVLDGRGTTLGGGGGGGCCGDGTRPGPAFGSNVVPPPPPPPPVRVAAVTPPPPPPPPVPPPPLNKVEPMRIGGDVLQANCLRCPAPDYPPLARAARITDTVMLSAVVGKDGKVKDVRVVRGHTLLQQAALDAVRRWEYKPQLLNGETTEVTASISISFVFR